MKFLIIDNYDSFVYNIAQYLGELGVESDVIRNDKITLDEIKQNNYDAIVISPGPGTVPAGNTALKASNMSFLGANLPTTCVTIC